MKDLLGNEVIQQEPEKRLSPLQKKKKYMEYRFIEKHERKLKITCFYCKESVKVEANTKIVYKCNIIGFSSCYATDVKAYKTTCKYWEQK